MLTPSEINMFDATTIQVLGATLLVTLVALLSSSLLMLGERSLRVWIPRLVALAVGVLLGDAFLHLIPDAIEVSGSSGGEVMIWTLIGIVSFLFLENVLNWRHQHDIPLPREDSIEVASFAKLNLAGDGVHNFVDGVLIASSFLVDPALGTATTIAIVLHEVPQEVSDLAVLMHGGYTRKQAIVLNTACASICIVGAISTLLIAQYMQLGLGSLLAFTAGGFIYIATSDLVPLLRDTAIKVGFRGQFASILTGIVSMQSILWVESALTF